MQESVKTGFILTDEDVQEVKSEQRDESNIKY